MIIKQYNNNNKNAFTLIELLIVIAIIAIIAIIALITLNPLQQINKSWDAQRKHDLELLRKVFEDYYNNKQCYPKPSEVCYNSLSSTTCNICGNEPLSPSFAPYLSRLPCDPNHPTKNYFYQVDSASCPTWYRIYNTLSDSADRAITEVGCQNGCGPSPDFKYNYGVSSPNIGLETNSNLCSLAAHVYINPFCNICGTYNECKISHPNEIYYTDPASCKVTCIKD